ncbi:MAG: hypothetical protein L3K26_18930 [Candidatus Hydrogenedentes bacterium]|nr:hypothetical protein [Candidatus Hydrogenedentota bacterium]
MTYKGYIQNGMIVLDEPTDLPDGVQVRIDICDSEVLAKEKIPTLAEALAPFIGKAVGMPEDAAENHDHYLYGTPKK